MIDGAIPSRLEHDVLRVSTSHDNSMSGFGTLRLYTRVGYVTDYRGALSVLPLKKDRGEI